MTLYEIDQNIMALIDEDGEITDPEAFDALQITRSESSKASHVGLRI